MGTANDRQHGSTEPTGLRKHIFTLTTRAARARVAHAVLHSPMCPTLSEERLQAVPLATRNLIARARRPCRVRSLARSNRSTGGAYETISPRRDPAPRVSRRAVTIPAKLIEDTARELMARAAIDIPPDYREGVRPGARPRAGPARRASCSTEMLSNWDIATAERRPMCADTGLPRYYVRLGNEARRRGRARGARAGAPPRDRRCDGRDPAPPQPRAPAHARGPQQQRRAARPRGHLRGRARWPTGST